MTRDEITYHQWDEQCKTRDTKDLAMSSYSFEPLQHGQIRLCYIEAATSFEDPVYCTLRHVNYQHDKPKYLTLSYAWGQSFEDGSHLTHHMVCSGQPLAITENLYIALRRIRQHLDAGDCFEHSHGDLSHGEDSSLGQHGQCGLRLPIWIDAICINQSDLTERNRQVQQIGEIFEGACELWVWLGESEDGQSTVRHIDDIYNHRLSRDDDQTRSDHQCVADIIKHPGFRRRWVIQEVFFTRQAAQFILLGNGKISAWHFLYALEIVQSSLVDQSGTYQRTIAGLQTAVNLLRTEYHLTRVSSVDYLRDFAATECTDPRDLIYTIIPLANDLKGFQIDYTESVEKTYCRYAEEMVRKGKGPEMLMSATHDAESSQSIVKRSPLLPTWVPDWRDNPLIPWYMLPNPSERHDYVVQDQGHVVAQGWILQACMHEGTEGDLFCQTCRALQGLQPSAKALLSQPLCEKDNPPLYYYSVLYDEVIKQLTRMTRQHLFATRVRKPTIFIPATCECGYIVTTGSRASTAASTVMYHLRSRFFTSESYLSRGLWRRALMYMLHEPGPVTIA